MPFGPDEPLGGLGAQGRPEGREGVGEGGVPEEEVVHLGVVVVVGGVGLGLEVRSGPVDRQGEEDPPPEV